MHAITKSYRDLPAAHRQPKHDGHCRLIHGHNWGFDITISAKTLDVNGFVVDVGKLYSLKRELERLFDHTLLLNEDDPLVNPKTDEEKRQSKAVIDLSQVVVVPNCGMEGLARFVYKLVQTMVAMDPDMAQRGVHVVSVTCLEDSKNTATYNP